MFWFAHVFTRSTYSLCSFFCHAEKWYSFANLTNFKGRSISFAKRNLESSSPLGFAVPFIRFSVTCNNLCTFVGSLPFALAWWLGTLEKTEKKFQSINHKRNSTFCRGSCASILSQKSFAFLVFISISSKSLAPICAPLLLGGVISLHHFQSVQHERQKAERLHVLPLGFVGLLFCPLLCFVISFYPVAAAAWLALGRAQLVKVFIRCRWQVVR